MLPLALALTPGADTAFEHVRDVDGCAIAMRPESHPEGAAMRADCRWSEVDPGRLIELLSSYERYDEIVYPVVESRVVGGDPDGRALVYQRQSVFGIADREVLIWMWREDRPSDTTRIVWTTASEQPLTLRQGAVRTPKNEGYWQIAPDPAGGARVVHQVAVDAGGSIPRWIVALVRTRGFARVTQEVRALAAPDGA